MTLTTGSKLGPYQILALVGAGGMGEVYRARDTRLDRSVAVKVLNSALVATPELRARFEREAKVISHLQHPNICVLHDVGSENGSEFLVMEFLDGESLADRLRKGPLPIDEVLKISAQVASALDKAHRAGVVHRDLKPGNIMLTKSGAKLMDFGLAKYAAAAVGAAAGAKEGSSPSPPTMSIAALNAPARLGSPSSPLTQHGEIVGTFQYIAPEVLQGMEADARSDIFSFGCVLYEMLTARRAFDGKSQVSVLAAILDREPEQITMLRPECPEPLAFLVHHCLAKDPERRVGCTHDLALQIDSVPRTRPKPGKGSLPRSWRWLIAAAVFAAAVLSVTAGVLFERASPPAKPHLVTSVLPLTNAQSRFGMALSPDGRYLVYSGATVLDRRLVIHSMESGTERILPAPYAVRPFWSPDGRYVGFVGVGKLKKVEVASGTVYDIADLSRTPFGVAWAANANIIFGGCANGIMAVSSAGGKPETLVKVDQGCARWPVLLDHDMGFVFTLAIPGSANRFLTASIDGRNVRELPLIADSTVAYASGYLFFSRQGGLYAQALAGGRLLGEAVQIADKVSHLGGGARAVVSPDGTLIYEPGGAGQEELVMIDAKGAASTLPLGGHSFNNPRFSPDGRLIAYDLGDANDRDVWIYNLALRQAERFTLDGLNSDPIWSPDGKLIAYTRQVKSGWEIVARAANGAQGEKVLVSDSSPVYPRDWSPDSRFITFDMFNSTIPAIWRVPTAGGAGAEYIGGGFDPGSERISPDGKWIVYQSSESGQAQIYLESFPERTGKWQVSTGGVVQPRWGAESRRLYFLSPENKLVSAELAFTSAGPQVTRVSDMFSVPPFMIAGGQPLDATRDGSHFVLNAQRQDHSSWVLLQNWMAAVKK
jgi:serine/threonine protein kinase/Tol biopolymer transport system component